MKMLVSLILILGCVQVCAADGSDMISAVNKVPSRFRPSLVKSLGAAESNASEWIKAINTSSQEHLTAVAFLIANMPIDDLKVLKCDMILRDINLAYKARNEVAWGKSIPEELFLNDVLPYVNLNEKREEWRPDFVNRFLPAVKNCKSIEEAVGVLNSEVFKQLHVQYHPTKRPKPDQNPSESAKAGYASCTGLSIMLTDACRACCIPARVAGIPDWTKSGGNHTWVEIWTNQWRFVGAAEPGPLDQTWFTGNAAEAVESEPSHSIYAASYGPAGTYFPMVWNETSQIVPAWNVSAFYTNRRKITLNVQGRSDGSTDSIMLRLKGQLVAEISPGKSIDLFLAAGKNYRVEQSKSGSSKIASRDLTIPLTGSSEIAFSLAP